MEKRLITHLVIPSNPIFPPSGLRKLFFYTRLEKRPNEYYFGTDNNTFGEAEMSAKEEGNIVIRLPKEVELFEKKGLWVSQFGNIFYADLVRPNKDTFKRMLFECKELIELHNKTLETPT